MSLLERLFKKPEPLTREHLLFGSLHYSKHDGWENRAFEFWGFSGVQLLLDADRSGPTVAQEQAFVKLRESRNDLLPRCLAEVERVRTRLGIAAGAFRVRGLSVPALTEKSQGSLWTLWFDLEGDDHFMYGVQSDDDWHTMVGFADD